MQQLATITRIKDRISGPVATLTVRPGTTFSEAGSVPTTVRDCSGCRGKGCGFNILDALFRKDQSFDLPLSAITPSPCALTEGQQVVVQIDDRALLQLSLVGYGVPILAMVVCVLGSSVLASSYQWQLGSLLPPLIAAVGFVGGLLACQPLSNHLSARRFITIRGRLPVVK